MGTAAKTVDGEPRTATVPVIDWKFVAWFAALLVVCYAPVLYRLASVWATDEDMGHGFFVPVIAGYIVWKRRDILATIQPRTNYWGLAVMLWGALQFMLGTLGAELFLARTAFLISLAGLILFTGGTRMLKALAFPLILMLFMIPIPAIIYARMTLPLQKFASSVAETLLGVLGYPVLREGNVIELANGIKLSVVEACSGIRSLLSLSFLSLIFAYFFDSKVWMRWALFALTIPIAITVNALRVTITGIISEYRPEAAQGTLHMLEGWVLFMIAFALLFLVHRALNFVYDRRHHAHA